MNRLHIAVLASGRGSNLQSIIDCIEKGALNAQIACVASDVKNANALERAREHSIEALFLDPRGKAKEEYYSQIADARENGRVKLVLMVLFMRIAPASFTSKFAGRIINIHPSLLPSFPGLHPPKQAPEAGGKGNGCTVH